MDASQLRPRTPSRLRRCTAGCMIAALAVAGLFGAGGCEALGADLEDSFNGLFPPSPTQAVVWAADTDPDLRRRGTLLLANAPFGGEEAYVRLYRDYAENESNPLVKSVAIRALARHGETVDAALIATQLTHDSRQVRWEAARGLQRLHDPDVSGLLLEALRDTEEDVQVRVSAATALGQYGTDVVFQGLVAALDEPELAINDAAQRSLRQITGADEGDDPSAWLTWYEPKQGEPGVFAEAAGYTYPTYERDPGFLEKLAFWNPPVREFPGPPRGLVPAGRRGTYDGEDGPIDGEPDGSDSPATLGEEEVG